MRTGAGRPSVAAMAASARGGSAVAMRTSSRRTSAAPACGTSETANPASRALSAMRSAIGRNATSSTPIEKLRAGAGTAAASPRALAASEAALNTNAKPESHCGSSAPEISPCRCSSTLKMAARSTASAKASLARGSSTRAPKSSSNTRTGCDTQVRRPAGWRLASLGGISIISALPTSRSMAWSRGGRASSTSTESRNGRPPGAFSSAA